MSTIKVSVVDQVLTIADSPLIASGDVNVDHVQFTFDDSWRGFGLAAVFYREGESQVYRSVIPRNGLAVIPHEVMVSQGRICFGVAGVSGSDVKTTEIAYYDIHEGAVNAGAETQPPTPGIYEQMLSSVGDLQDYFDATVDAIERSAGRVVLFSGLASSLPVVETIAGSVRRLIFPNSKTITDFDRITLQFSNLGLYGLSSGTGNLNIHNGSISIAELTVGVSGGYALVELAGLSGTPGDNAYRITVSNFYEDGGTGTKENTTTLQKGAAGYLTGISYLDMKITSNTYVNVIGYNNELIAIPDEPDDDDEEAATETLYVHMTSSSHADMTSVEIFNALLAAQQQEQDLHIILEDHTGRECAICYKPAADSESARFFTLDYSTNTLIVYTVNTSGSVSVSSGIYCHGMGFGYGECNTAAATTAKTATINNFRLGTSGIVIIKFANAVPASATLNISSTGAKPIYYAGAAITAGVINAGATVTMVYANSTYIVLSIDDRYRKPDTGIPEADLSEAVREKLNTTGLTKFITVTYYDGEYYASAGPAQIFQDLDDGNVQYVLIDRYGRQCTLVEPPELPTGSTAKFAGIDADGDTIYIHTISTVNTLNLVSTDSVPISGSSSSATWNDIKPSGGIPESDLASAVRNKLPLRVTISWNGSIFSSDKTFSEVSAAEAAGNPIDVAIDNMYGWFGYITNDTATFFAIEKNSGGAPSLYVFELTASGVSSTMKTLGDKIAETKTTVSGATPTIAAAANTIYACGELTSLTISSVPAVGEFTVIFTSGSTATTVSLPATLKMPSYTIEANMIYELNVLDGRGVIAGWSST